MPAVCRVANIHTMIVAKNPDVSQVLSADYHVITPGLFVEKNRKFSVLNINPDVRKEIMRSAKMFIGICLHFMSYHYYKKRHFACQLFGQKQGYEECPAKGADKLYMFWAGLHRSSD